MTEPVATRPEFRNIRALQDLPSYRLPAAGWVSILHRVSGALMFLLLPFIVWLFDKSISSEISFAKFKSAVSVGIGVYPGWFIKLTLLALICAATFSTVDMAATTAASATAAAGGRKRRGRSLRSKSAPRVNRSTRDIPHSSVSCISTGWIASRAPRSCAAAGAWSFTVRR